MAEEYQKKRKIVSKCIVPERKWPRVVFWTGCAGGIFTCILFFLYKIAGLAVGVIGFESDVCITIRMLIPLLAAVTDGYYTLLVWFLLLLMSAMGVVGANLLDRGHLPGVFLSTLTFWTILVEIVSLFNNIFGTWTLLGVSNYIAYGMLTFIKISSFSMCLLLFNDWIDNRNLFRERTGVFY